MGKAEKCTKCGKMRVIEYVCTFGMDEVDPTDFPTADCERKPMKRELCKKCTPKNKCRHFVCRANYRGLI